MRPLKVDSIPRARIDRVALARFFEHPGEFDLEIGCGVGWHPIQYASAHPERRLIAIERTADKFKSFERRLAGHPSLKNILPLHADATAVLAHDLTTPRFSRVFLLYPNPEPRNPAQRWIRRPFFKRILEVCRPDAEITFATNEEFYFQELLELGPREWGLTVKSQRRLSKADLPNARTHFEKKYLTRGETCFELHFLCP